MPFSHSDVVFTPQQFNDVRETADRVEERPWVFGQWVKPATPYGDSNQPHDGLVPSQARIVSITDTSNCCTEELTDCSTGNHQQLSDVEHGHVCWIE